MEKYKIGKSMRVFLLFVGVILWCGILLTGFAVIHWIIYLPAVLFILAAATGICPGMALSKLIANEKSV
jgi:hypothetical protein